VSLEAFAIYLCGWTLVPLTLHHFLPDTSRWWLLAAAALSVPVAMFWPRWRGLDRATWRRSVGLHKGRGFWRETGAGIVGWIATCPLIVLGLVAANYITRMTGQEAGHPIIGPLTSGGGTQLAAVLLAVVWAPLAEEVTFRGLLFPGLSAWFRWIGGALVGAFVFAVIHPQGWAGVPAIMGIALGASMVRLVRGSLIAPAAFHAFNNGSLVLMLVLCAG
jgi:membrane protease YdiL (CAAX protease family)